jgi:hypothetical protein
LPGPAATWIKVHFLYPLVGALFVGARDRKTAAWVNLFSTLPRRKRRGSYQRRLNRERGNASGILCTKEDEGMKKIGVLVIALALAVALGTAVMAQELMKVTGWVSKIDTGAMSVTILPEGGTPVTVIMGNAESLSKVEEGDKAEARYRVKDGKNMGRWLHKISEGCS